MADTVVFSFLDALTNNNDGTFTINSTHDDISPFTVTFDGSITPGSTFTYTDGNHATFTGTYEGTNDNGDLIFNVGGSYELLTNEDYPQDTVIPSNPSDFVCFLAGTLIATPEGERLVETLRIGDEVLTVTGEAKPIVWVGSTKVRLRPWSMKPVIVRAGALADGLPRRDLRLTEGHSLLLNGMLIPVASLVNRRSIVWDEDAVEVEYYHIEVEGHDVILAEGAAAETYRNDGNRKYFPMNAVAEHRSLSQPNEVPPCAPIVTAGPDHVRIWRRLCERAGRAPTSDEADIHLVVDSVRVDGERVSGTRYRFCLHDGAREVRLASAIFRPIETGAGRDYRTLGVAAKELVLRSARGTTVVEHRSPLLSEGWHGDEAEFRWTDGYAKIPLHDHGAGSLIVEIEVAMTGGYPLAAERPAFAHAA